MTDSPSEITELLDAWSEGDAEALDKLMPHVFEELHRIAERHLRKESVNHTLQPTALVNEIYLKFKEQRKVNWQSRAEFYAVAAMKTRRILVDHARARQTRKRGSGVVKVSLDDEIGLPDDKNPGLLILDDALVDLARLHPRQSRILELRIFGGFTLQEIVVRERVSRSTVTRDWDVAVRWLHRELSRK